MATLKEWPYRRDKVGVWSREGPDKAAGGRWLTGAGQREDRP
jgi:hypothetical protein